jgi:hypothetical protein
MTGMHVSVLALVLFLAAADDAKAVRYGIAPDPAAFPQKTPQETLASVVKAIDGKRFDYLAAQLADPVFIDQRVHRLYAGRFADQVDDLRTRMDDPTLVLLRRYLKDGTWEINKESATVTLKDVADRLVAFRLIGSRWFIEHRSR